MKNTITFLLIFFGFLQTAHANATIITTRDFVFSRINLDEFHRQYFVEDILRDDVGFIWFATREGLYRYDGKSLKNFQNNPNDSTSLKSNYINGLCLDNANTFWVVSEQYLYKYDKKKESFTAYRLPRNDENSDGNNIMSQLKADKQGNIWIATWDRGLLKFDTKTLKFKQFGKNIFKTNTIRAVLQDRMNTLWIAAHTGLFIYNPQTDKIEEFSFLRSQATSKEFTQLNTLFEDKNGVIWIGSNGGIVQFERLSASITFIPIAPFSFQKDKNIVEDFYDNGKGHLWVATRDGLFIYNKAKNLITKSLIGNKNDEAGLLSSDIRVLYNDNRGSLWIGSHNGGINKYALQKNKFETLKIESNEIGDNRIFSIFQSNDNLLWLGTENGLYSANLTTKALKSYNHIPALQSVLVSGIAQDIEGNLWVGTDKDGLIKFNPKTQKAQQLLFDNEKLVSFSSNDIWDIYSDSKGRVWLCKSGNGLVCYDPKLNKSTTYTKDPKNAKSISSNTTGCIVEDEKGGFWIGTSAQGLNYLNPENGEFTHYFHEKDNKNSLINNKILSLYVDSNKNLWIGTIEGLDLFNVTKNTFQHFGINEGLTNLNIQSLKEDNQQNIWASTSKGLFKHNKLTGRFIKYTSTDGLPSDQFLAGSVYKNQRGIVFFGTENGLVYFDPKTIELNKYIPNIIFTNIKLFNKNVPIGETLSESVVTSKKLDLNYKENYVTVEFAVLDYQNPSKNKYSWYLEGLEKTWNDATAENWATYNNLAPGNYILKVKASNNDDVWNEAGIELFISIHPPFYLTWWFKFLGIVFIIGLVLAYYYIRVNKIKKENILLEKKVAYRTETINQQKDALERANLDLSEQRDEIISQANQLKEYNKNLQEQQEKIKDQTVRLQELDKVKTKFFANISHEFRTPLTLIIGPLSKLMNEATTSTLQKQYEIMLRNAHRLLRLINQLLDLSSIDAGYLKLKVSEGDINNYVHQIFDTFALRAERQSIYYQYMATEAPINGFFDWDKVEKIVYNLLSNAFKNTPDGGSVIVNVSNTITTLQVNNAEINASSVEIRVADTGVGIPSDLKNQIFERFYRVEHSNNRTAPGAGIGLSLTKELILAHYGTIQVESELGKGSEFIVTIPIDKQCFSPDEIVDELNINIESNLKTIQLIESTTDSKSAASSLEMIESDKPILLIIEDDKDLNNFLSTHFSAEYFVKTAFNGIEGLNTAFECLPDLIVSDIMMPGDDGLTISKILKTDERTNHIPIILLTAKDAEIEKITGLETGVDDYITKPFEINLLEIRIRNLIDQRKKLMERFGKIITLQPTNIKVNKADDNFLMKAMDIIERNMENPSFDVDLFTREIGISRTLLYRKVRALTNQSINDFIRSVRLKRAAQLLQSGTYNVTEAALQSGFTNQSYFSKCFEQQFGELPSKYANKYK